MYTGPCDGMLCDGMKQADVGNWYNIYLQPPAVDSIVIQCNGIYSALTLCLHGGHYMQTSTQHRWPTP